MRRRKPGLTGQFKHHTDSSGCATCNVGGCERFLSTFVLRAPFEKKKGTEKFPPGTEPRTYTLLAERFYTPPLALLVSSRLKLECTVIGNSDLKSYAEGGWLVDFIVIE